MDDGIPDRSGEICDDYATNDPRIHEIHKENGEAQSAWNLAVEMAKDYMYFLDSDDWVDLAMLEDMYNLAKCDIAQLVVAVLYRYLYWQR